MTRIDSEHQGPLVNIAAFLMIIFAVIFVTTKILTKWLMIRKLQNDDFFMICALFTAIGYCVAVSSEVQYGLGQPETNLSLQELDRYQKANYVSQIFYVLSVFLPKMATLQFQITLSRPSGRNMKRMATNSIFYFIALWLVAAVFCVIFQCKAPNTWNQATGRCFNLMAFWIVNGTIDVLTQLLIAFAPIYLLWSLQLPKANKRIAIMAFTPNLTTIPLIIIRLIYLSQAKSSADITFASFNAALVTTIHANYSIIASCLPFLKPMIDSLAIGLMTNDIGVSVEEPASDSALNPFGILSGRMSTSRHFHKSQSSGRTAVANNSRKNDLELLSFERFGSPDLTMTSLSHSVDVDSRERSTEL